MDKPPQYGSWDALPTGEHECPVVAGVLEHREQHDEWPHTWPCACGRVFHRLAPQDYGQVVTIPDPTQ